MPVIVEKGALRLYGAIGFPYGTTDIITAGEVAQALQKFQPEDPLNVYINSPGGDAFDGMAIYSMLTARPGRVSTVVDGLAASGASLAAMAGASITMMPGSLMMIHDAHVRMLGNADALRKTAEELDLLSDALAKIYASRSGKSVSECRAMMKAETWFSEETAVAEGFAHRIGGGTALAPKKLAFDYSLYTHAPAHLVAMAKAQGGIVSTASQPQEIEMTTDIEVAKARLKAIMKSTEAEGRAELAEHLAFETDMPVAAALTMLAKAPSSITPVNLVAATDARRLAAAALAMPGFDERRPSTERRVDLAASMKRRQGLT